jgi:translin
VTWHILKDKTLFVPDFDRYDWKSYLHGMAESIGELRRYVLDLIREGKTESIEEYLGLMEDLYYFLRAFDYQEGLTRGLRRMVDSMRQMLEKTRADISLVVHQVNFAKKFGKPLT